MAFEDGLEEVVQYLTSYFLDGGKELAESFGDQGPSLAAEMGAMLEERFLTVIHLLGSCGWSIKKTRFPTKPSSLARSRCWKKPCPS